MNAELYGTTVGGGAMGYGTVFKVSTSGSESVVHSFGNVPDGAYPYDGLIALHGAFYGTTYAGGVGSVYSKVFQMSKSGKVHVIYSFNPNSSSGDGEAPTTGVIAVKGRLLRNHAIRRYGWPWDRLRGKHVRSGTGAPQLRRRG